MRGCSKALLYGSAVENIKANSCAGRRSWPRRSVMPPGALPIPLALLSARGRRIHVASLILAASAGSNWNSHSAQCLVGITARPMRLSGQ